MKKYHERNLICSIFHSQTKGVQTNKPFYLHDNTSPMLQNEALDALCCFYAYSKHATPCYKITNASELIIG